jgi:chromosome segregation ATPase
LKHKTRYAIEVVEYENIENSRTNLWISFKEKLDNNDIEICSRVYRDGESEYFLNRTP